MGKRLFFLILLLVFSVTLSAETVNNEDPVRDYFKGPFKEAVFWDSLLLGGLGLSFIAGSIYLKDQNWAQGAIGLGNFAVGLHLSVLSGSGLFEGSQFLYKTAKDQFNIFQEWQREEESTEVLIYRAEKAAYTAIERRIWFGTILTLVGMTSLLTDAVSRNGFLTNHEKWYFSLMLGTALVSFLVPSQTELAWWEYQNRGFLQN